MYLNYKSWRCSYQKVRVAITEVAHPYDVSDKAGYQIDFAGLAGDTSYVDTLNLAGDPDTLTFLTDKGREDKQKVALLETVRVLEINN